MTINEMKSQVYIQAVKILNDMGYESSFRGEYSGRGMYGATCPAIVTCVSPAIVGAVIVQASEEVELQMPIDYLIEAIVPKTVDSMGLSQVHY